MKRLLAEGSPWSKPGLAAYNRRDKAKDRAAYAQDVSELPTKYANRVKAEPEAWTYFRNARPSYRKQVARWVVGAKREETRERRLRILIESSAEGKLIPLNAVDGEVVRSFIHPTQRKPLAMWCGLPLTTSRQPQKLAFPSESAVIHKVVQYVPEAAGDLTARALEAEETNRFPHRVVRRDPVTCSDGFDQGRPDLLRRDHVGPLKRKGYVAIPATDFDIGGVVAKPPKKPPSILAIEPLVHSQARTPPHLFFGFGCRSGRRPAATRILVTTSSKWTGLSTLTTSAIKRPISGRDHRWSGLRVESAGRWSLAMV